MISPKNDRPYFEAWLRRTGKQFAVSGRLTQTAAALSATEGGTMDEWRSRLRTLMEGEEVPSMDLLMSIDGILAGPSRASRGGDRQEMLFQGP